MIRIRDSQDIKTNTPAFDVEQPVKPHSKVSFDVTGPQASIFSDQTSEEQDLQRYKRDMSSDSESNNAFKITDNS